MMLLSFLKLSAILYIIKLNINDGGFTEYTFLLLGTIGYPGRGGLDEFLKNSLFLIFEEKTSSPPPLDI